MVLAGIASIFAGPPGVMPSETTNENATSVAPKFAQIAATRGSQQLKEAPDIGSSIGSFMLRSNYLVRTEMTTITEESVENAPANENATTVSKKEKANNPNDEGVPARLTDFKMVMSININEKSDKNNDRTEINIRSQSYPAFIQKE